MRAKNRDFIVDPILDPLHFGFTQSIVRYHEVRKNHPDIEMMLGVGNITELTHADTIGMNALLLGICSELNINSILATEVQQTRLPGGQGSRSGPPYHVCGERA